MRPLLLTLLLLITSTLAAHENARNQHVFFENSAADAYYYHSESHLVAPSELELSAAKCPVTTDRFVSPPNCLRLKWRSRPGGDWRMTIKAEERYARKFDFQGGTLVLWCFAHDELTPDDSPRIRLQDQSGNGLPEIPLLKDHPPLAAGKWKEIRIPISKFVGQYQGTTDPKFNLRELSKISFVQNLEDDREHTLYIDDIRIIDSSADLKTPPAAPTALTVIGHDSHFDLAWSAHEKQSEQNGHIISYRIYRAAPGEDFTPIATRPAWSNRHVDFIGRADRTFRYKVSAIDVEGNESPLSEEATGTTRAYNDDELLDMIQAGCFRYYWEAANPESGMAIEIVPGDSNLVATGATGFGIMAQIVATEREFITRDESTHRMLQIVRFLKKADRFHGVWPHFLHGDTGRVNPFFGKYDDGGDLVETAFLVQGLLAARQYFNADDTREREIRDTITQLWREVEWDWHRKDPTSEVLYWHWSPNHAWQISHPLIGWNETMIVYLLAIASPTHAVPPDMYHTGWAGQSNFAVRYRRNWSRTAVGDHYTNGTEPYGIKLDVGSGGGGDLFFTQFSFLGFDPRDKRDRYTNYFNNNRNIALINRAYCLENPRKFAGYGADCWGLSAGINSGGGRPAPRDDNGTICTSAVLGSFPYTPQESLAALKHFYRDLGGKTWGVYGFHDGFNQQQNWFDEVYMGLNLAQIVVGIENHRNGLIWRLFMANPEITPMLKSIGFKPDPGKNSQ